MRISRQALFVDTSLFENFTGRRCYRPWSDLALDPTSIDFRYIIRRLYQQGTLVLRDIFVPSTGTATAKTGTTIPGITWCSTCGFLRRLVSTNICALFPRDFHKYMEGSHTGDRGRGHMTANKATKKRRCCGLNNFSRSANEKHPQPRNWKCV